jgi:hypothetical protein
MAARLIDDAASVPCSMIGRGAALRRKNHTDPAISAPSSQPCCPIKPSLYHDGAETT